MKTASLLGALLLGQATTQASILPVQPPRTVEQAKHRNHNQDSKIVGGKPVDPPLMYGDWMVAIQRGSYQFCAGSMFAKNLMVTAAHCSVLGIPYNSLRVSARRHCLNKDEEAGVDMGVEEIIVHPDFDYGTLTNDIAVWRLKGGDDLNVTVRLDNGKNSYPGRESTVIGWGATKESGMPSNCLLQVSVPIVDQAVCQEALGPRIVDSMLCAGGKAGQDACQGDSGGPMTVLRESESPVLTGVVSWGRGCARAGLPGVYTRVSRFRSWLRSFMAVDEQLALDLDAIKQTREVDEEQTKPGRRRKLQKADRKEQAEDDSDSDDDEEREQQSDRKRRAQSTQLRFQRKK